MIMWYGASMEECIAEGEFDTSRPHIQTLIANIISLTDKRRTSMNNKTSRARYKDSSSSSTVSGLIVISGHVVKE